MSDVILEFQRREELAPCIIQEVQASTVDLLAGLDEHSNRLKIFKAESKFLTANTPNILDSTHYLAKAYMWQANDKLRKNALSKDKNIRQNAKELQDNIRKYFILGGFFGSLVFRLQNNVSAYGNDNPADLATDWVYEFAHLNHDGAQEFFTNLAQNDESTTWEMTNFLESVGMNYTKPVKNTKQAVISGAQSMYHLQSFASWQQAGVQHPLQAELKDIICDASWKEFEIYKSAIRKLLSSSPAQIRHYKEISKKLSGIS